MSSNEILRLENISKFYKTANNVAIGIRKVNASFHIGEFVIITGASGSGKSTLLNVLSGMTSYEEGVMYINGEDSSYYGHNEYEKYRKDYIACIFQNYNIIDSYSVYENIELALIARGVKKEERKPLILDVAKKVGIDHRLKNKVTKLSGGEKQRTAIARALVSDAPILVCDEITGNLDHDTSIEIIKLLHSLSQDKLVLMVTHDPEEVMQYATRVISMYDGSIQSDKVLKEVNYTETVKIKDTKPIKKGEIVHLALKSFKNTPKKSILLVLIFGVFSFSYVLISNRYISNTASETILRMDKQVGLTIDQKVTRDYTRYKELIKDIEKTNDTTVDRYNAFVERQNEFVIEGLEYKVAYANEQGFYIDGQMYTYLLGLGETDYYKYPFSIYRLQEVFGDAYADNTNYAVFRIDDILVLFDCNTYLYDILANVEGMPENYFLIVENNCGIAYQKNNNLVHTSLVNAYIATQESTKLADEMYKREGGYEVLLFGGKNSLFVYAPILSDLTNDSFNLVYVVDQKLVLNTVSYLRISLLVIFATIFILVNITMLILGIYYV